MNYPEECAVTGKAKGYVLELIKAKLEDGDPVRDYAEIGVYAGDTTVAVAEALEPGANMHLFDFSHRLSEVEARLRGMESLEDKDLNVRLWPNTDLVYDSYNWSLASSLIEQLTYDFVYIDGAHTWHHDGMAFLLADRMLRPGGIIVMDDNEWTISTSLTMRPAEFPEVVDQYTEEQISALQVKMIIELLIKPDPRYVEIIPNYAFQKVVPPVVD